MPYFIKFSNNKSSAFNKFYRLSKKVTFQRSIVMVMEELQIKGIYSYSDQNGLMLVCEDNSLCTYIGINHRLVIFLLTYVWGIHLSDILGMIYRLNSKLPNSFLSVENFYINNERPFFSHGRCMLWSMEEPLNISIDFLVGIISKYFIGIGGYITRGDTKIIFYMHEKFHAKKNDDYSHCVSHEINHDLLKENYYRQTPKDLIEKYKYAQCKNRDIYESYLASIEKDIIECMPVEIFDEWKLTGDDTLIDEYMLNNVDKSEKIYIDELSYGFRYLYNVSFGHQVIACALIAGVSYNEMIAKLDKASGK